MRLQWTPVSATECAPKHPWRDHSKSFTVPTATGLEASTDCAPGGRTRVGSHLRQRRSGVASRFLNELHARAEAELGVDVGEVGLHGTR